MTLVPELMWPEYTRMKVSVPKNGCVATLKARAENGSSLLGARVSSTVSSPGLWPIIGGTSRGDGR